MTSDRQSPLLHPAAKAFYGNFTDLCRFHNRAFTAMALKVLALFRRCFRMSLFAPALGVLGYVLIILSVLMLVPTTLAIAGHGLNASAFLLSFIVTMVTGMILFGAFRHAMRNPSPRQMFLITGLSWIGVSVFSALPLFLSHNAISLTNALFESVSGITTTGSTVLIGLDTLPRDLLLWRSLMQWIGGIGVIGMAVSILPFLRVGAMRLFQTESSDWSEKAVAREGNQLRYILLVYLFASTACAGYYFAFGMDWFEAVNHAMTTISTGGFSTSDASIGHFDSPWIQWGSVFFMVIGGLPFLFYIRFVVAGPTFTLRDTQVVAFLAIIIAAGLILTGYQVLTGTPFELALRSAFLNTTSVITTTGYASADYGSWGTGAVAMFYFLMVVGGCSGSTSGGIKVFRLQLMLLFFREQVTRSIHPRAVIVLKYNQRPVNPDVVSSFIAFMGMATVTFMLVTLILSFTGLDLVTSSSSALTAIMNVGPGLGSQVGPAGNFNGLPDPSKWALCVAMLLGRLEYLTLLVLLAPAFWRD